MKRKLVFFLELLIALIAPCAWLLMVFHARSGPFTATGIRSLRYFTVLSNLFAGINALVYVLAAARRRVTARVLRLNLMSTAAVAVTFLTVFCFLGPLYGLGNMLQGPNLWFHLIIPLTAMLAFCLMGGESLPRGAALPPLLCPLLYGLVYYLNICLNGIGTWPKTNDWYGFLNWGTPVAFLIFGFILLIDWAAALSLIGLHRYFSSKEDLV